jgi:hypothetical protein
MEYEMVHCRYATASSCVAEVWGEVFAHFHAAAIQRHSSIQTDCLVCHDEFFVNNSLDVKEIDENALCLSYRFRSQSVWTFHVWFTLSSLNACLIIAIFSEICTKFDDVPSSDPLKNRIMPDT